MSSNPTSLAPVLVFVFSHNDEATIGNFLGSLLNCLVRAHSSERRFFVYVLANGCKDSTVERAQAAIEQVPETIRAAVVEIAMPGKANAWNHAVHELAPLHSDAEVSVFMDSDIDLTETDLSGLVRLLEERPDVLCTTSRPMKRKVPLGAATLVPAILSRSNVEPQNGVICGQLYAARRSFLDQIWMPRGLLVEDGFLAACLRTKLFTQDPDDGLILMHPGVTHRFEVERSARAALRHEERIELGSHMNFLAFPKLWAEGENAGRWLQERYEEDPDWLVEEFERTLKDRGLGLFKWKRALHPFRALSWSSARPAKVIFATLRSAQRSLALWGAYRKSRQGDFGW